MIPHVSWGWFEILTWVSFWPNLSFDNWWTFLFWTIVYSAGSYFDGWMGLLYLDLYAFMNGPFVLIWRLDTMALRAMTNHCLMRTFELLRFWDLTNWFDWLCLDWFCILSFNLNDLIWLSTVLVYLWDLIQFVFDSIQYDLRWFHFPFDLWFVIQLDLIWSFLISTFYLDSRFGHEI